METVIVSVAGTPAEDWFFTLISPITVPGTKEPEVTESATTPAPNAFPLPA